MNNIVIRFLVVAAACAPALSIGCHYNYVQSTSGVNSGIHNFNPPATICAQGGAVTVNLAQAMPNQRVILYVNKPAGGCVLPSTLSVQGSAGVTPSRGNASYHDNEPTGAMYIWCPVTTGALPSTAMFFNGALCDVTVTATSFDSNPC